MSRSQMTSSPQKSGSLSLSIAWSWRRADVGYDSETFDLKEILDQFRGEHRNIVLLELAALAQADGLVSVKEGEILNDIAEHFGTNPHLFFVIKEWAKNMISIYLQGDALTHI